MMDIAITHQLLVYLSFSESMVNVWKRMEL